MVPLTWKTVWPFLKITRGVTHGPAIPLLGIENHNPMETLWKMKPYVCTETPPRVLTAAPFMTAERWRESKRPSTRAGKQSEPRPYGGMSLR